MKRRNEDQKRDDDNEDKVGSELKLNEKWDCERGRLQVSKQSVSGSGGRTSERTVPAATCHTDLSHFYRNAND
jgi:hypothetical protein